MTSEFPHEVQVKDLCGYHLNHDVKVRYPYPENVKPKTVSGFTDLNDYAERIKRAPMITVEGVLTAVEHYIKRSAGRVDFLLTALKVGELWLTQGTRSHIHFMQEVTVDTSPISETSPNAYLADLLSGWDIGRGFTLSGPGYIVSGPLERVLHVSEYEASNLYSKMNVTTSAEVGGLYLNDVKTLEKG